MAAPSGVLATHLDALADTIAKSATFQTLVGAGDEATAKAKILRASFTPDRPWAFVFAGRGYQYVNRGNTWKVDGRLAAVFEAPVTPADPTDPIDYDDELDKFDNAIGGICDDVMDLVTARTDGVLQIEAIRPGDGEFLEDDEGNQYIAGIVEFELDGAK